MVSATMLRGAVVLALGALSGAVKMGGHIQDKYVTAFKPYKDWANKTNNVVVTSFKTYNATTMAADVAKMTTPGDATYVDVLICPYGSSAVIACVGAVNKAYKGPVIAWGGASDAIFDTSCAALTNNNCFGFFTVGSDYAKSGLVAVGAKMTPWPKTIDVALIVNDNGFSRSVAVGVKAHLAPSDGMVLQSNTTLSVSKKALTDADKANVKAAMDKKPDIVVIVGHNMDVEPTIIAIGKGSNQSQNLKPFNLKPHAIIATNGISNTANYGSDSKYAQCVMMPTQWDSSTAAKDSVVGWDSAAFKTAMGGSATYHQASAGAVGVAIANALKTQPDVTKLVATLQAMDVDSFYGKLKWDAKGRIQKPMYTQQLQMAAKTLVAPTGTANMKFPLGVKSCWSFGDASKAGSTTAGSTTAAGNQTSTAGSVTVKSLSTFLMCLGAYVGIFA